MLELQPENYYAQITKARYLTKLDQNSEALSILESIIVKNNPNIENDAIREIISIRHQQGEISQALPLLGKLCLSKDISHIRTALMLQLYADQEDNSLEKLAFENLRQVLPSHT